MLLQAPVAAFIAALASVLLLLAPPARRHVLDRPNARSLHERAVPRTGGIAIAAGIAAAWALSQPGLAVTFFAALALAAISLADDVLGLPAPVRIAAHLVAAAVVLVFEIGYTEPVLFAVFLFAIAWTTNLYNFMDGSDGLAGGMAMIGFGAYAVAAQLSGADGFAAACAAIAASSAAFLVFNFHPARLFMGDVGSIPLGFLAGALGVWGWSRGHWPIWFPALVFAPFMCDATLTLVKRLLKREPVWRAHRDHYYQRLVRMGFGHRGTALIEYAAMAGCAAIALAVRREPTQVQLLALAAAAIMLVAVAAWVDVRWRRHLRDADGATA